MSNYEPGTIAVATVRGVPNVRVMRVEEAGEPWVSQRPVESLGFHDGRDVTDIRPLVVLDLPADRACLIRDLMDCARNGGVEVGLGTDLDELADLLIDQIEQQTRPPKPAEPKGRYAEVQDAEGYVWFRDPVGSWRRVDSPGHYVCHEWESVPAVGVLSEGVQP